VVIAIIALLVSILIPSLRQARELAGRSVCLGNLRSATYALHWYAEDFRNKVPLFFHNSKQQNHWIWYGGVQGNSTYQPHWFWQGALYAGGALKDVQLLYCPSDRVYRYATEDNPWPVQDYVSTRSSYGNRPMYCHLAGHLYWPPNMPRLAELENKAVFSDWTPMPEYVTNRHDDGVNVAYIDGSASWVPREKFDLVLAQCTTWRWDYGNGPIDALQDEIWKIFDQQR